MPDDPNQAVLYAPLLFWFNPNVKLAIPQVILPGYNDDEDGDEDDNNDDDGDEIIT